MHKTKLVTFIFNKSSCIIKQDPCDNISQIRSSHQKIKAIRYEIEKSSSLSKECICTLKTLLLIIHDMELKNIFVIYFHFSDIYAFPIHNYILKQF